MQNIKLVLLGSESVGKSAITLKFCCEKFVDQYDPTIEDIYRKPLQIDDRHFLLEILDTAGAESFCAMRDLYIKNGQGFMVLYSVTSRRTFEELKSQDIPAQIMRCKGYDDPSEMPLVLVGNKSDLPDSDRAVTKEEGAALAASWGACAFFETSAKIGINVNEAFTKLVLLVTERDSSFCEKKKRRSARAQFSHLVGQSPLFRQLAGRLSLSLSPQGSPPSRSPRTPTPDGSEGQTPDGSEGQTPDGSEGQTPDGPTDDITPDGFTDTVTPDGSVDERTPGGPRTLHHPVIIEIPIPDTLSPVHRFIAERQVRRLTTMAVPPVVQPAWTPMGRETDPTVLLAECELSPVHRHLAERRARKLSTSSRSRDDQSSRPEAQGLKGSPIHRFLADRQTRRMSGTSTSPLPPDLYDTSSVRRSSADRDTSSPVRRYFAEFISRQQSPNHTP